MAGRFDLLPGTARACIAAAMLAMSALPCDAQNWVARADALLREGRIVEAEPLYYYAARIDPRNAASRAALGKFLASRGKLRIGAVLLEEARLFGGDRRMIAEQLAPLYARLGDYRALSSLPSSPLSYAERARAEWLSDHPADSVKTGPDSVVIDLMPLTGSALGQIRLTLGTDSLVAMIDPAAVGLVLDTSWARRSELKVFRSESDASVRSSAAVALNVVLGGRRGLARANIPVRFEPLAGRPPRIGLDVLEDLAPTWVPETRTLVLRTSGRAPVPAITAEHIPILIGSSGISMVRAGIVPLSSEPARSVLSRRWTLDIRQGEIISDR